MSQLSYELRPFDRLHTATVAAWVADEEELFRLAPGTAWPLTSAKVIGWVRPKGRAFLLFEEGRDPPSGYAELNPLRGSTDQAWIGHVVLDPRRRGRGLGKRLTQMLIETGLADRRINRLVMVVFPDNHAAVGCYRAAGFRVTRRERHRFAPRPGDHTMLRLEITREEALAAGIKPATP
ncbi:MAG: GNAT family N-acetyltransferase [bacterium]|nr:GNAT family N-acetyltransferase [bacterium]